jgi:hydroxyacylglutathione hydrolase
MKWVESIPARSDNYVHALIDSETQKVWLIDPSEPEPILEWLANHTYQLSGIYITHHHYDHIEGVPGVIAKYPTSVYAPVKNKIQIPFAHVYLEGSETLLLDSSFEFQVIASPGHTQGHILYYESNHKWLFCGDTFFNLSCGRIFDGTPEQLFESLQKISKLDADTQLYCAHEYTLSGFPFCFSLFPDDTDLRTYYEDVLKKRKAHQPSVPISLGLAMKVNPYLRAHTFDEFMEIRQKRQSFQST